MELNEFLKPMNLLTTKLPPQFMALAGFTTKERFVGIWYESTNPTISDGRWTRTFSYYRAFDPLVSHITINAFVLLNKADLGSDDSAATHVLVLDTAVQQVYLATWADAHRLLRTQLPMTPEEIKLVETEAENFMSNFHRLTNLADFQKLGMFEFLGAGRVSETTPLIAEMTSFLDTQKALLSDEIKRVLNLSS